MTVRQILEATLIETNKEVPSLLLEDFNYLINKKINQHVGEQYLSYDQHQYITDELRVLSSTATLPVASTIKEKYAITNSTSNVNFDNSSMINSLVGAAYEVELPRDYLHILNCICVYRINKSIGCLKKDSVVYWPAKKLTADLWSNVITNVYNSPAPTRPYFYLHNVNTNELTNGVYAGSPIEQPTSSIDVQTRDSDGYTSKNAFTGDGVVALDATSESIKIGTVTNPINEEPVVRYGNASPVRMEIRYGKDNTVYQLIGVNVDYLKTPQHIVLTQEQLDYTEDKSQIMEFPDYVCQEIINGLVTLILERSGNPRLQTNLAVNQTPVQQSAQQQSQTK